MLSRHSDTQLSYHKLSNQPGSILQTSLASDLQKPLKHVETRFLGVLQPGTKNLLEFACLKSVQKPVSLNESEAFGVVPAVPFASPVSTPRKISQLQLWLSLCKLIYGRPQMCAAL